MVRVGRVHKSRVGDLRPFARRHASSTRADELQGSRGHRVRRKWITEGPGERSPSLGRGRRCQLTHAKKKGKQQKDATVDSCRIRDGSTSGQSRRLDKLEGAVGTRLNGQRTKKIYT